MESDLPLKFFKSFAPEFFSQEILRILSSEPVTAVSFSELLKVIDSLVTLLESSRVPLGLILPQTFERFLLTDYKSISLVYYN